LGVDTQIVEPERLEACLKSLNADIFHIHRGGWPEPGPIKAASLAGIPIIVEHNVFGRMDDSDENDLIDCHILISYSCAWRYQMWLKRPLVTSRYEVLYYPVEIDNFDSFGFDDRDFSKKIAGRIGRADNTKWDFKFLEALPIVLETIPDFKFHVIGMTPEVRDKFKEMGAEKCLVEFPMTTDEREVMGFYSGISVLAHFAEMGETFGLVLAEAMAAKLPVVTHHTVPVKDSAQSELINSGYNGIVAVDAQMYADALIAILSTPKSAKSVGLTGYNKARSSYDAKAITRGLEDIFMEQVRLKELK
jgi:glycosyltransferase involved in cell wall biosynthesis